MARINPGAWAAMLADRPDLVALPLVSGWVERGWPLVIRRPDCAAPSDLIALGIPLPPSHGKQRIAVSLPATAITDLEPPPRLAEAAAAAPDGWRATIARLLGIAEDTRTFGSLAWEHLTGMTYLSPTSDIDVLWTSDSIARLKEIKVIDDGAPMRIDGEIVAADGGAVQWRELLSGSDYVLVKRLDSVGTMPRAEFVASA